MSRFRGFKVCLLFVVIVCLDSGVFAADWQIDPYMKATTNFDDNIRFNNINPKGSTVGILDLGLDLTNESEVVKTTLSPHFRYSGYASDSDLNNDAQFLDFSTRSDGERSTPSLEVSLMRDSALDQLGDDTSSTNIDRVLVNKQRNRWRVKPAWSYRFTAIDALDLSLEVDSISYDDAAGTGLVDYVNQVANLSYVRSISEIKDIIFRLSQTQYESDPNGAVYTDGTAKEDVSADTVGVELGITNEFTERTKGSLFIGSENTDTSEQSLGDSKHSGLTVKAIIDHKTEADTANVTLSSGVVPSTDGIVRDQDSLRIHFDRIVNVKLGWGINALLQKSQSINEGAVEDLNYYYLEPSVSWFLTKSWKLAGTYRFSLREFDQNGGEADRNELGLSIEYRRPPREELERPPSEEQ